MKNKVILSLISSFIIIPLFIVPVAAQTTNVQTTNHGTVTYSVDASSSDAENLVINLGPISATVAGKKISTVNYQLDNYYTGTITFQANGPYFSGATGTNNNCELYLVNCTIVERNQDKLTVYIKEQRELSISIVRDNSGTININDWYQIYSETLTAAGSELNTLNGILAYCSFINDDTLDIAADVEAIRTYMGYSGVSDTVHTDLNAIKGFIETLGTKYDTMNGKLTSIQSYVIHIDQVLGNIYTTQKFMTNYSYINEYNSQAYNLFYKYDHTINYRDTFMSITVSSNDASFNGTKATSFNPGYCLLFAYSGNAINDMIPYVANTNTSYIQYNYLGRYYQFNIYEIVWTHNQRDWISFKINSGEIIPFYFGYKNNMPSVIYNQFYSGDNPLISSIKSVENAVRNMAVNVNNLTVNATGITYNTNQTDVTNSVTNYNTNINQVFNIENNLSTDFNTYNQQFNPDFTDALTSIQVAPDVMNGIMVSMYDLPFIKYPVLITLAGIVLLAFLGV